MGDFLYIPTDPVVIMEANAAIKDMGLVPIISAILLDGPPGVGKSYLGQYLQYLLKAKLVRAEWTVSPSTNRRVRVYEITKAGLRHLEGEISSFERMLEGIQMVLGPARRATTS